MTIVCRFQVLDRDEGDPAACHSFYWGVEDASLAHGVIVSAAGGEQLVGYHPPTICM
jgi:hypothetical protein